MRKSSLAAIFTVALLLRLGIAIGDGMFHRDFRTETEGIALNVAELGHYALYYSPSAYATPVVPLFVAALYKLFGTGAISLAIEVVLACLASALRCAIVPLFALDAGFEKGAALLAGWIGVFYIGALDTEVSGGLDGPFVALALVGILWGAMRLWRSGSWRTRSPWGWYLLCGFSALLNPGVLPVIAGIVAAGAIACPREWRWRFARECALAAAGMLLFLGPWAVRNELVVGSPILTRSNFGIEFWVSNGPDRTFDHPYNYGTYHPSQNPAEAQQVGEMGEVAYSKLRFSEGLDWVESDPMAYLRLTAIRFLAWWFPPRPAILLPAKAALTLAALVGFWLMFRRQRLAAWLILITWLTFPDIYYLVQWSSRYRYPLDWEFVLCASAAIFAGWRMLKGARRKTEAEV